jgi:type II secretory pathway component PulF
MYLSTRTVMHTQIREALENVSYQIQSGQRFSASVAQTGLMPDMVLIMFSSGEESGELEKMLGQALSFLETEVENRVELLMSLMEPLLLLVMGAVVLVMALSVYMPLFSMYENV